MAVEPEKTPSTGVQVVPQADLAPRPEVTPLIDLETDPFGTIGEGEDVAGGGRKVIERVLQAMGKVPENAPKQLPEETERVVEKSTEAFQRGSALEVPESVGGTTRPLPNVKYYQDANTRKILDLYQGRQAAREPVTWEQTKARAEEAESLLALRVKNVDSGWTAAELQALRNQLTLQAGAVRKLDESLMRKINADIPPSPEELAEFEMKVQQLNATHAMVSGVSSEVGRALNILRSFAEPKAEAEYYASVSRVIDEGGGPDVILEKIKHINAAGRNTGKIIDAAKESAFEKFWNGVLKMRYNNMLSSVRTHGANVLGSAIAGVWEAGVINTLARGINVAERGIRVATRQGKWLQEDDISGYILLNPEQLGLIRQTGKAWSLAKDMALGREVPPGSFKGKFINEMGMRYKPHERPEGVIANVTQLGGVPTRLLEAEDAFFRTIYYQGKLEGLVRTRALAQAGDDQERYATLYSRWMEDPPEDLRTKAKEFSEKLTFTNDPNIYGKILGKLGKAVAGFQNVPYIGRLILPFVKTPVNLFNYTLQQTGFGQMLNATQTMRDIAGSDARVRAEALSRIAASVGLFFLAKEMWEDGTITGIGSTNPRYAKLMEGTGWKPNAMRVGDEYVELRRLDPMGLTFGLLASMHDVFHDPDMSELDKLSALGGGFLQLADLMMDRGYMSGLSDVFDAVSSARGGIKKVQALASSTALSIVTPNILRDFREMFDPVQRTMDFDPRERVTIGGEVRDADMSDRIYKQWLNAMPVASKSLPPRVDWKGDPLEKQGWAVLRGLLPISITTIDTPRTTKALINNQVIPSYVKSSLVIPNSGSFFTVPLLALDDGKGDIYAYYQQLVGEHREKAVEGVLKGGAYGLAVRQGRYGTRDTEAGQLLSDALREATATAKKEMLRNLQFGRTVTLYKGTGAETKIELPKINTLKAELSAMGFELATPEERKAIKPPEGTQIRAPMPNPQIERTFGGPQF